eukprot:g33609.t1
MAGGGNKSEAELSMLRKALKACVLLSNLNQEMVDVVANGMERKEVDDGTEIISQGTHGDLFYINNKGIFDIYVDGTKVAQKKKGDFFGELALMHDALRSATVIAAGKCEVFQIRSDMVRVLVAQHSFQETKARLNFLMQVPLLQKLSSQQRSYMAEALKERTYLPGEAVVKQGDDGDEFFIVKSGELTITITDKEAGELKVGGYKAGGFFGELALINDAKRAATVSAKDMVVCLSLKKKDFSQILGEKALHDLLAEKAEEYTKRTKRARESVSMPAGFNGVKTKTPAATTTPSTTKSDATTSSQLSMGSLSDIAANPKLAPKLSSVDENSTSTPAPSLGTTAEQDESKEDTSTETTPPPPSIKVDAGAAPTGPVSTVVPETPSSSSSTARVEATMTPQHKTNRMVDIKSMSELEVLGTLGRGAFGHVRLVRDKKKRVHAMKTLNKHLLVETQQVEHVRNEIYVMSEVWSPFVIEFRGWFQDPHHLHLLMQPSLGGELATLLDEKETLQEEEARFVVACIVLGFEHLHDNGIVYRDLKPENVLLEPSGYLRIVDFGFAKKIADARTFTLCGTPEYLSPEVIQGNGHGYATDFWSLGIILFEMLTGETPYCDSNPMGTYQVIMRSTGVPWPDDVEVSEEGKAFVEALLTKDAPLRLGVNGPAAIKSHAWYKKAGFEWGAVEKTQYKSPFPLEVEAEDDMSRFEDYMGEDERWQDFNPEPGHNPFENF